jgi:Spy/CpxP family protein refolding chaperone
MTLTRIFGIVATLALFTALCSGALAQEGEEQPAKEPKKVKKAFKDKNSQRLAELLGLSEDQIEKIKAMQKEDKQRMKELQEASQQRMREVLTEEQRTRYDEIATAARARKKKAGSAKEGLREAFQKDPKRVFEILVKELGLTGEQIQKVRAIGQELKAKGEKMVEEAGAAGDAEKIKAVTKTLQDEMLDRLRGLLNDKQKARFDAVLKGGRKALDKIADRYRRARERNPAYRMQSRIKAIREALDLLPEEAMIILPKVEGILKAGIKVQTLLASQGQQLKALLKDPDVPDEAVEMELSIYRELRDKGRKEMEEKQKDLRELLTFKQEATLVLHGVLK